MKCQEERCRASAKWHLSSERFNDEKYVCGGHIAWAGRRLSMPGIGNVSLFQLELDVRKDN